MANEPKVTEEGLPVFTQEAKTGDELPIFDVKKKDEPISEDASISVEKNILEVEPNVSKEKTKEVAEKGFNKATQTIETNVKDWYSKQGALTPMDQLSTFERIALGKKNQFEQRIQLDPNNAEELKSKYQAELNELANEYGLSKTEGGGYSVGEKEVKLYQDVVKNSYDKYIKDLVDKGGNKDPFWKKLGFKLDAGSERILNIPTNLLAISEAIYNAGADIVGAEEQSYWQDRAKVLSDRATEKSQMAQVGEGEIVGALQDGDFGTAAANLTLNIAEQVPQLMTLWAGNAAGLTNASLGIIGTQVGTEKYVQNKDLDIPEYAKIINAITSAGVEVTTEMIGTIPILKNVEKAVGIKGADVAKQELKAAFRTPFEKAYATVVGGVTPMVRESASEVAAELSNQIVDKVTIDPTIEIGKGLGDVAITSAVIGKVMSAPGDYAQKKTRDQIIKAYNEVPIEYSAENKVKATELILKIDDMNIQKEGVHESLRAGYDNNINKLNDELIDIANKEANISPKDEEIKAEIKPDEEIVVEKKEDKKEPDVIEKKEVTDAEETKVVREKVEEKGISEQKGVSDMRKIDETEAAQKKEVKYKDKETFKKDFINEQVVEQNLKDTNIPGMNTKDKLAAAKNLREGKKTTQSELLEQYLDESFDRGELELIAPDKKTKLGAPIEEISKPEVAEEEIYEEYKEAVKDPYWAETAKGDEAKLTIKPEDYKVVPPEQKDVGTPRMDDDTFGIKTEDKTIPIDAKKDSKISKLYKKYLSSKGFLPDKVFKEWIGTKGKIKSELKEVEFIGKDFNKAIKKAYEGKVSEADIININNALTNMGVTQESKAAALKDVPENLHPILIKMRDHIDTLSKRMVDEGIVEGDLLGKFDENLGFYMTRTYRAHNDPKWKWDKIPDEIKNRAVDFIRKEYPDYNEEQLRGVLKSYVDGKDSPFDMIRKGKLGSKDLGVFKKRTLESKELKDLLGEYRDPLYNYATSISKMSNLIEKNKFLNDIREQGLNDFLFDKPTEEYSKKIAAEGSQTMMPLNGLYTTPEIAEAFDNFDKSGQVSDMMRNYMKINAAVKYGKTILSPITHVRNFVSNYGFHIANGRSPFVKGPFNTLIKNFKKRNDAEWRDYYKNLVELGVVEESVWEGEVHDTIKDATQDFEDFDKRSDSFTKKVVGKSRKAIEKAYQVEDDVNKIFAFEGEKSRYEKVYKKQYPDKSDVEIDKMANERAAEIVRMTMPTYSLVPDVVKKFRRSPVVGTFVSFPAEVLRTAYDTVYLGIQEMKDPATKKIGQQRIAGVMTMTVATGAAAMASRALLGMDAQDDEDLRRFVAPWSKNGQLIMLRNKGNGEYVYVDLGYSDPWNYMKNPIMAVLKNDDPTEGLVESAREMAEPFIGEDLLASKIIDLSRNKNKNTGEAIYNKQAPIGDQFMDMTMYIWKGVEPGIIGQAKRIQKSIAASEGDFGKKYDLSNELIALFTGQRVTTTDVKTSYKYRSRERGKDLSDARNIYTKVYKRTNVPLYKKREALDEANEALNRIIQDMHEDYVAARRLGVSVAYLQNQIDNLYIGSFKANDPIKLGIITGRIQGINPVTGSIE
jgi:hypothetical protein